MSKYCPEKDGQALYTECLECDNRICERQMFFCLVAGSRGYDDYGEFSRIMDTLLSRQNKANVLIVSGHCSSGADALAERYAAEHGIAVKLFPAEWKKDGKKAGYLRNRQMHEYVAKNADIRHRGVVLFWDGRSHGTAHSIGLAQEYGNPIRIWDFEKKRFVKKEEK